MLCVGVGAYSSHKFNGGSIGQTAPSEDGISFVDAGTLGEPSKIEVRKDGRAIGRILHVAESLHAGWTFQFHKGPISIALSAATQFSRLEELKKWIGETQ
jgi:hypothetical protein